MKMTIRRIDSKGDTTDNTIMLSCRKLPFKIRFMRWLSGLF